MPEAGATTRRGPGLHFSTDAATPSGQDGFEAYHDLYAMVADGSLLARRGEAGRIADLAHACGFTSESDCSRAFKAAYGLSPSEYRRLDRDADAPDGPVRQSFAGWWNDLR